MQFKKNSLLSFEMNAKILGYYKELYISYRRQSVSEIARDLEINPTTVRKFVNGHYWYDASEKVNFYKLIMLCTIFSSSSPYYEEQQRLFQEQINEREKIRRKIELYNKFKPLIEKNNQKSKKL